MERIKYKNRHLRTVSLFAGAGGLDLGFLNAGFDIVWANDIDRYAVESYTNNISDNIVLGDINDLLDDIPQHDVLIGGFPCQPFSMMGQQLGFEDERGTLFFTIEQIVRKHRPKVIVLENVKNLETHNGGETFARMKRILKEELIDENGFGYEVFHKVLNSSDFGVPQTRRRVFVVAFDKGYFRNNIINFEFPKEMELSINLRSILDDEVDKKYFLSEKILPTILSHGTGNYYSKSEIDLEIARPLCATMHKMHRASQDNYVTDLVNRNKFNDTEERKISSVRRLTPNECRKLQGFPSDWIINVSDTQAYRQFGNAVTVDVAYHVAMKIVNALNIKLETEE
ncbi:DNA cytosine methyltransferase [Clostridium perfringens]|uniref:DNA cytosine methyltransferase n=1 Tax=Clostridium perfringens TaxID=1502 RepID=UPI0013E32A15|nr:DNA (cytosine-5-)-methyltransferase [Clostridium perfringens]MCX0391271.1 DNA (cytosine-5-)-methyltransferase [Clostridium perfringens]MDG6889397.1 Modification methylase HhaI [Clostridium perfringens]NGT00308.1 DNA (cytosine-5-)-methyltransferase [Clostridium perfringens]